MFEDVEIITAAEAARILKLTPLKVSKAVHDGVLPIGFVIEADPETNERNRTVIIKKRLERWLNGEDLRLVAGEKGGIRNE